MNVLSLFDGISCGQVALERAGIPVTNYYASEIEPSAIKVTQTNYPSTIQLGDVTKINASDLPRINLIMGGSPCQGFSFAGKQLNFDDPRSALFFEFVRLKKELNPTYWLLENVKMKREYQDKISEILGCEPTFIDSADFSAQSRKRLYWTNFPIEQWTKSETCWKDVCDDDFVVPAAVRGRYQADGSVSQVLIPTKTGNKQNALTLVDKVAVASKIEKGNLLDAYSDDVRKFWRYLSISEYEKLQTLPVGYTNVEGVSKSSKKKAIGNGWTVDVIAHIFKGIK